MSRKRVIVDIGRPVAPPQSPGEPAPAPHRGRRGCEPPPFRSSDTALSGSFSIWSGVISASGPVSGGSYGPLISIFPTRAPLGSCGRRRPRFYPSPRACRCSSWAASRPIASWRSPSRRRRTRPRPSRTCHPLARAGTADLLFGVHANLQTGHRQGVQLFVHSPF